MAKYQSNKQLVPLKELPVLSVCIPAYNEEGNIGKTIDVIEATLRKHNIPHEFVIANDNSTDKTKEVVQERMNEGVPVRLVNRVPPGGFGRAIRACLENFEGDIVAIVMADLSDDPEDLVKCYNKIQEGYDAVYGSRFLEGSIVSDYPFVKLIANRFGNKLIQLLFRTRFNDLTNAFKVYRREAIESLMPLYASHFNLTIELSVGILIRGFKIEQIPINWYGRTWGCANFKIKELGRRYFATLFKLYSEKIFIHDDVIAEHDAKLDRLTNEYRKKEHIITNVNHETFDHYRRRRVRGV